MFVANPVDFSSACNKSVNKFAMHVKATGATLQNNVAPIKQAFEYVPKAFENVPAGEFSYKIAVKSLFSSQQAIAAIEKQSLGDT